MLLLLTSSGNYSRIIYVSQFIFKVLTRKAKIKMSAINIIGKSQRVVDAPGLSIEELAGKFSKVIIETGSNINFTSLSFQEMWLLKMIEFP